MEKKRHVFDIQLNSITDTENPTRKECEFILHDFEVSHNNAFISKTTAEKTLHTLKDMPIVCQYFPVSEAGAKDDALGTHGVYLDEDRETGDPLVGLNTIPIGVFTEDAYVTTITDQNGDEKEVVAGKGILWASRFPNIIGLLKEWNDAGVNVSSSMEILYDSYLFKDGVEEILSYVYEGHCVLNSEQRGNHSKVYPAYDVSKLNKLVAQAINQEVKEGENMDKFKKVFELSHGDVRSLLYGQLDPTLGAEEYSWISDVYDSYFVANIYSFADGNEFDKYFKFNYSKGENDVTIDFESKAEVTLKRDWIEVTQVQQMQNSLDEKVKEVEELTKQINEVNSKVEEITSEKDKVEKQFNEVSEKVVELSSQVEELKPFKNQVEEEQMTKALNEKKEFYSAKFKALNASDKFDSEEVQALVEKAVFENEEGKQAILQLNTMLVDMVVVQKEEKAEDTVIREVSSKRENLIPTSDDFESRYSN